MAKKTDFTMNIGLPSIMLIFIVLCLVSFGILSLVSSNSDKKLSQKVLTRSTAYYDACNQAEDMLCDVDAKLHNIYETASSEYEFYNLVTNIPTSYTYNISDLQYLFVELKYIYPDSPSDLQELYSIMTWKVMTNSDLKYDTGLNLIEIY